MKYEMTEYRSLMVMNPTSCARGPGFDIQTECLSKQDFHYKGFRFLTRVLLK